MEIKFKDLNKILPEAKEIIKRRRMILKTISELSLPGRRTLAKETSLGERVIRNEVEILAQEKLILVSSKGIDISAEGKIVLEAIQNNFQEIFNFEKIEGNLQTKLNISKVIVIPGDSGDSEVSRRELGRAGAKIFGEMKNKYKSISVAGGRTLAEVASQLIPLKKPDLLILPARGGLGEEMEIQANTISAKIAGKLGASYRLLHIPDAISEKIAEELRDNQQISQVISLIRESEVIFLSVSNIKEIIRRGQVEEKEAKLLKEREAVGEALGYFFNSSGEIVYSKSSIGINIEDLEKNKKVVLIAGGKGKSEAIEAVAKKGFADILITDEGAAEKILN